MQDYSSWTIPLGKNIRYTSFQFYAKTEPAYGITVEQLYIKQILYILRWIRKKCTGNDNSENADLPVFLQNIPSPDDFRNYSPEKLDSFRYNVGYQIEIMVTKDKRNWAMSIREIDRGPKPDNPDEARRPVPGRFFVTDIGLRRNDNNVEIATRTYIDEPIGTKEECDAFRQAFLTELIRDKDMRLQNDNWLIQEKPYEVSSKDKYENFIKWLKSDEREALAVVYCALPAVKKIKIKDKTENAPDENTQDNAEEIIIDYLEEYKELVRKSRAYAFFFQIPESRREVFLKDITSIDFSNKSASVYDREDLFIIGAKRYDDSDVHAFSMKQYYSDGVIKQTVKESIQKYYVRKKVNFFGVQFVPDLKDILAQEKEEFMRSEADLLNEIEKWKEDYHILKINSEADISNERSEKERIANQKNEEIRKLKEASSEQDDYCKLCAEEHKDQLDEKDKIIERLKNFRNRPKKFKDIPEWVKESFPDRLIMCERAKKEIERTTSEYDFDSICNAIEHLAYEYCDYLRGDISENVLNDRSAKIYNRFFENTKVNVPAIGNKTDYKFEYRKRNGTICKADIDKHLYLNESDRIYYIYDKQDKRIVIASLPKHLKI